MSNASSPVSPVGVTTSAQAQTSATQQLIADVQAAIAAATTEGAAAGATVAQQAAAQAFITQANAFILDLQASLSPAVAPTLYVVQDGDTLPALAQDFLGDPSLFPRLQSANSMVGLYIAPGQQLVVPSSGTS